MGRKQLMFQVSNSLSKLEAIQFVQTLDQNDKYYLVKTHENPKARHIAKRERYVIVRDVKKGEFVSNGHALFLRDNEMLSL